MPTQTELIALHALTKERVTNYNDSEISGYKFTGNGNTIFLPFAGQRDDTNLKFTGSRGHYWSSCLTNDRRFSSYYYISSVESPVTNYGGTRYVGFSVRPVYAE